MIDYNGSLDHFNLNDQLVRQIFSQALGVKKSKSELKSKEKFEKKSKEKKKKKKKKKGQKKYEKVEVIKTPNKRVKRVCRTKKIIRGNDSKGRIKADDNNKFVLKRNALNFSIETNFWENEGILSKLESFLFVTKDISKDNQNQFVLKKVSFLDMDGLLKYFKNSNNLRRRLVKKKKNLDSDKSHLREMSSSRHRFRGLELKNTYLKMNLMKDDKRFMKPLFGSNSSVSSEDSCGLVYDSKPKQFFIFIFSYVKERSLRLVRGIVANKQFMKEKSSLNKREGYANKLVNRPFDGDGGLGEQERVVTKEEMELQIRVKVNELNTIVNTPGLPIAEIELKSKRLKSDPMFFHPSKRKREICFSG